MWGLLGTAPAQQRSSQGCTKPPALHSGIKTSPNPALQLPQHWVRSPNSTTALHSPAAKPQSLLSSWHNIPRNKGHRTGCCEHRASGLALEGGLEGIHPTGKVVIANAHMGAEGTEEGRKQEPS